MPAYSPSGVVQKVKSVTAREVFSRAPEVKKKLWGGEFWGKGYFVNTVGQHGSEKVIAAYVKGQGGESNYHVLHKALTPNLKPRTGEFKVESTIPCVGF